MDRMDRMRLDRTDRMRMDRGWIRWIEDGQDG